MQHPGSCILLVHRLPAESVPFHSTLVISCEDVCAQSRGAAGAHLRTSPFVRETLADREGYKNGLRIACDRHRHCGSHGAPRSNWKFLNVDEGAVRVPSVHMHDGAVALCRRRLDTLDAIHDYHGRAIRAERDLQARRSDWRVQDDSGNPMPATHSCTLRLLAARMCSVRYAVHCCQRESTGQQ